MYVAANLQLYKILNLKSINSKSIEEIRGNLNKQSTKWSNKPILFSNIKNLDIKMNNEKIPVRIYTPENGSNFPIIIYSHGGFGLEEIRILVIGSVESFHRTQKQL